MESDHDRIRVIDLETGGNGPDDVCEIGWQDLIRGADRVWRLEGEPGAVLVNPGRSMLPDTMAVHHILDEQVADAPFWRQIGPSVLRPVGGVAAPGGPSGTFRATLLSIEPHWRNGLDLHVEVRAARVAASAAVLQSDAPLSSQTRGAGPRQGIAGPSRRT